MNVRCRQRANPHLWDVTKATVVSGHRICEPCLVGSTWPGQYDERLQALLTKRVKHMCCCCRPTQLWRSVVMRQTQGFCQRCLVTVTTLSITYCHLCATIYITCWQCSYNRIIPLTKSNTLTNDFEWPHDTERLLLMHISILLSWTFKAFRCANLCSAIKRVTYLLTYTAPIQRLSILPL